HHKEGRALRTETTINDPRDFQIRKGLSPLSALRKVGFQANRRLLDVQRISHDCAIGEAAFARVSGPVMIAGQRAPALRFADPVVQALLSVLILFRLLAEGWRQRDLAESLGGLLGISPSLLTAGRLTYQLRRLRLRGLIARQPGTHRYRVTEHGLRLALFFTRTHARLFRPGLALVMPEAARDDGRLRRAFEQLERGFHAVALGAKGVSQRDEVGIREADPRRPSEARLLLPLNQVVGVVTEDDVDHGEPEPPRRLQLLAIHEEAAVAADRNDLA